ncbi:MAG TPA: MarR family transcriptional regulator [Ilumatobacteraceae bacterium]|nr:MarR family transcriptional regulator [Ilumatobacteraceae bacterium]
MAADSRPAKSRVEVWRAFLEAHTRIVGLLVRELTDERSLSLAWYDVLFQLSQAGGRLRMQDLAGRLLIPRSSLTRQIDRMEAMGLVEREPSDEDGRGTVAVLTHDGRLTLRRAAPVHLRGIEEHFARKLDGRDVAALKRVLAKLTE